MAKTFPVYIAMIARHYSFNNRVSIEIKEHVHGLNSHVFQNKTSNRSGDRIQLNPKRGIGLNKDLFMGRY
jgi:hypothetical protein